MQALSHQVDEVIGGLGARQLNLQALEAQLAVAPDGLCEQLLLGAEVVVQQPPGNAGLARDVVKGRAGAAPRGDAATHGIDDALRLLAGQRARATVAGARWRARLLGDGRALRDS